VLTRIRACACGRRTSTQWRGAGISQQSAWGEDVASLGRRALVRMSPTGALHEVEHDGGGSSTGSAVSWRSKGHRRRLEDRVARPSTGSTPATRRRSASCPGRSPASAYCRLRIGSTRPTGAPPSTATRCGRRHQQALLSIAQGVQRQARLSAVCRRVGLAAEGTGVGLRRGPTQRDHAGRVLPEHQEDAPHHPYNATEYSNFLFLVRRSRIASWLVSGPTQPAPETYWQHGQSSRWHHAQWC